MFYNEESTHDLVHLDASRTEVKRLKGERPSPVMKSLIDSVVDSRRIVQVSGKTLLWLSGVSTLKTVDTLTYAVKEIPNFWNYVNQKVVSLFVTATPDFKRFAGIGLTNDRVQTLHVNDLGGGTGFSSTSISKVFKSKLEFISSEICNFYRVWIQTKCYLCEWRK